MNVGASTSRNSSYNETNFSVADYSNDDESLLLRILDEPLNLNGSRLRGDEKYQGFDNNSGNTWIYPTNLPIRSYQLSMTKMALFRNTLVVLPTGLGKTFIAAVVMYNIYRWYPTGKIIFMAPTRPLVAQQIEACRKIVGIPAALTAEITGKQVKAMRKQQFKHSKRVFFATPQTVQSDMADNEQDFPFDSIKLLVIDEAHKAKGRYAYVECVQMLNNRNPHFRILALSATPGHRLEDAAEVVRNLLIAQIEVRGENSIDVSPYTHKKNIKTVKVAMGDELTEIRSKLIGLIDPYVRNLMNAGVISRSTGSITKNWLFYEQKKFRENSISRRIPNHSNIATDFSICLSLYHALELLERHGIRVFLNFFEETGQNTQEKFFVALNPQLKQFLTDLRKKYGPFAVASNLSNETMTNGQMPPSDRGQLNLGHPKFDICKNMLLNHFKDNEDSKAIIFCEYRDSVVLLQRLLLKERPLIRSKVFVGQGGTGAIRAVTQKEQIQIMDDFRKGICNLLISTSVAEEGIDVGEVDLIICFDISTKNPTRFVQRIGRTGRKRQGKVIMLVTEGKEQAVLSDVMASKDNTNRKLSQNAGIRNQLYKASPRMVPPEFDPKCVRMYLGIVEEKNKENDTKRKSNRTKRTEIEKVSPKRARNRNFPKTSAVSKTADVRNFFKRQVDLDKDEEGIFSVGRTTRAIEKSDVRSAVPQQDDVLTPEAQPTVVDKSMQSADFPSLKNSAESKNLLKRMKELKSLNLKTLPENVLQLVREEKHLRLETKRKLLEHDYGLIKDKYEALQAIEAVENLNGEEGQDIYDLKKDIILIDRIFGGREQVLDYLSKNCQKKAPDPYENARQKFSSFFENFKLRDVYDSVDDFVDNKLREYEQENEATLRRWNNLNGPEIENPTKNQTIYSVNKCDTTDESCNIHENGNDSFESVQLLDNEYQNGSKYMSQWSQFKNLKEKQQASTPFKKVNNSSTLRKGKELDSPILKAFARAAKKIQNSVHTETDYHAPKPKMFSENLGNFDEECIDLLNDSLDEILADTEIDDQNEVFSKTLNESTCFNNKSDNTMEEDKIFQDCDIIPPSVSEKSANEILNLFYDKEEEELNKSLSMVKLDSLEVHARQELNTIDFSQFFEAFNSDDEVIESSQANAALLNIDIPSHNKRISSAVDNNTRTGNYRSVNELPQIKTVNATAINCGWRHSDDFFQSTVKESNECILRTIPEITENSLSKPNPKPKNPMITEKSPSVLNRKVKLGKLKLTCASSINNGKGKVDRQDNQNAVQSSYSNNISAEVSQFFPNPPQFRRKRVIESSSESEEEIVSTSRPQTPLSIPQIRKIKRRKCEFIDDEAAASEDDDGEYQTQPGWSRNVFDSIVVPDNDVEDDDPYANMRAKYLQSIKSPCRLGLFKIPEPREYNDMSAIFSQIVQPEDESVYKENSFVISDDESAENDIISQMCPLEQAEAILEARRKARRKQKRT